MNAPEIITPEALAAAESAKQELVTARSYIVKTADDYTSAGDYLKRLVGQFKEVEARREQMKAPALETCRQIDAFFKKPKADLDASISAVKQAMLGFRKEQERIQKEAEAKAAEAARKERERQQMEAAKKEEAARKAREIAEEKARKLEEAGNLEKAEAAREAADEREAAKMREADAMRQAADMVPPAPVVHYAMPKISGVSERKTWDYEIVDEKLIPDEHKFINHQSIRGVVKAMKDKTNIPGVRVFQKSTLASQGA